MMSYVLTVTPLYIWSLICAPHRAQHAIITTGTDDTVHIRGNQEGPVIFLFLFLSLAASLSHILTGHFVPLSLFNEHVSRLLKCIARTSSYSLEKSSTSNFCVLLLLYYKLPYP